MKNLVILTFNFPDAASSEVFLYDELNVISSDFDSIFIIPVGEVGKELLDLPENCKTVKIFGTPATKRDKILSMITSPFSLMKWLLSEPKKGIRVMDHFLKIADRSRKLAAFLKENDLISDTLLYSYWLAEGASIISLCKSKYHDLPAISRAHRFDLYEEDAGDSFPLFYDRTTKTLDEIHCISEDGKEYLQSKYPHLKDKVKLSYLGTTDLGMANEPGDIPLTVFSCSSVNKRKRVDLILESLCKIQEQVFWHHFGDGPDKEKIETKAQEYPHVKVTFHGQVSNKYILNFYKENPCHLFINLSTSEGLPVSLMEAISLGIPILATDVRGVREICNDTTGKLVEPDISPNQLANEMIKFRSSKLDREKIKEFWKGHFNKNINYASFARALLSLL